MPTLIANSRIGGSAIPDRTNRSRRPSAPPSVNVGNNPFGVAATRTAVWVTNANNDTVTRIDAATNETTDTVDVGTPHEVVATATVVWVANFDDGTVMRIDPAPR